MKRTISLILFTVIFIMNASLLTVSADSGYKITCSYAEGAADTVPVVSADTVEITFSLTDITASEGLYGVCFAVLYDTSALEAAEIRPVLPDAWKDAEDFNNIVLDAEGKATGRLVLGASSPEGSGLKEDGYSVTVVFNCLKDGKTELTVDQTDEVSCGVTIVGGKPIEVKGDGCKAVFEIKKGAEENESEASEQNTQKSESSSPLKWILIGIGAVLVIIGIAAAVKYIKLHKNNKK